MLIQITIKLIQEAENERMHLLTFLQVYKPTLAPSKQLKDISTDLHDC